MLDYEAQQKKHQADIDELVVSIIANHVIDRLHHGPLPSSKSMGRTPPISSTLSIATAMDCCLKMNMVSLDHISRAEDCLMTKFNSQGHLHTSIHYYTSVLFEKVLDQTKQTKEANKPIRR
jgi:hypothetical protein